jgi:hypothetical protein
VPVLTFIVIVLMIVAFGPILWQVPKALWPLRLNRSATRFTGLYRRYAVDTITGHASGHTSSTSSRTIGGTSGGTVNGTISGDGTIFASISAPTAGHTFSTLHDMFYVTEADGTTHAIRTANVSPSVGEGHLVSAAVLVHGARRGNAFVVYNHTIGEWWIERYRRGRDVPPKGTHLKMVYHLGAIHQLIALLSAGLGILLGILAQIQFAAFRKIGVKPLISLMERRPQEGSATAAPTTALPSPVVPGPGADIATQVRELTELHSSGALSAEQFEAAKAKLLAT